MKKKILVTGATGFIGQALCQALIEDGHFVIGVGRKAMTIQSELFVFYHVDLINDVIPNRLFEGVDCVVHLAGKTKTDAFFQEKAVREITAANVTPTIAVAKQAIKNNVKSFIFLSSIGVNGSVTNDEPFNDASRYSPHNIYAKSKAEAEKAILALFSSQAFCRLTIIRPPLVYGESAKGSFSLLLKLAKTGIPLPFGSCKNKRSLISLKNLIMVIKQIVYLGDKNSTTDSLLVSDGESVSTKEIIYALREGMRRKPRLFSFPACLFKLMLSSIGCASLYTQLFENLEIDNSFAIKSTGWSPDKDTLRQLSSTGEKYVD